MLFPRLALVMAVSDTHLSRSAGVVISEGGAAPPACAGVYDFPFPVLTDAHTGLAGSPTHLFMHEVNAAGMCDVDSAWLVLVSLHSGANPPALGSALTVQPS